MRLFSEHSTREPLVCATFRRKTGEKETWTTKGKSVVGYDRSQVRVLGDDRTCQMMLCAQVKSECC